jgi:hypothetical protein
MMRPVQNVYVVIIIIKTITVSISAAKEMTMVVTEVVVEAREVNAPLLLLLQRTFVYRLNSALLQSVSVESGTTTNSYAIRLVELNPAEAKTTVVQRLVERGLQICPNVLTLLLCQQDQHCLLVAVKSVQRILDVTQMGLSIGGSSLVM